ncbi:MAG: patatin-like phospholipase family protein, partial [Pseudomonadota bacterium]
VMAVRSRHILASSNKVMLWSGLLTAATLNMVSRRTLGAFFERALFYDPRLKPPCYNATGFPMQATELNAANLADVVVATGSIPLVLDGVRDIAGAKPGTYRDGGVIDYHLDLPQSDGERYTLYPHFFDRIVPGWFDKNLGWRRPDPQHVSNTILVSPSAEFVATLPNGKIPDRTDFVNFEPRERVRIWRATIAACQRMADEFANLVENDRLAKYVEPL